MEKKILMIDDNPDLLAAVKEMLQLYNFSCLTIDSPDLGIQVALRWRPDLILLDLGLPKMSGFGVLRELKNNPELHTIPVVILSGISDEEVVREGMDLGATAYLFKRCDARELVSTLRGYIEEHH